jgi:hypothetical protein
VRLSTPLFSMPPVTQSVQKPAIPVASQREGGGVASAVETLKINSQMRKTLEELFGFDSMSLNGTFLFIVKDDFRMSVSLPHSPKSLEQLRTFLSTLFHPENWQQAMSSFKGKAPIELKTLRHQPTQGHARP